MCPRTGRPARLCDAPGISHTLGVTALCSPAKNRAPEVRFRQRLFAPHPRPRTGNGAGLCAAAACDRDLAPQPSVQFAVKPASRRRTVRGAEISADVARADAPSWLTPVGRGASASRLLCCARESRTRQIYAFAAISIGAATGWCRNQPFGLNRKGMRGRWCHAARRAE